MTENEKLTLAQKALRTVLRRIKQDENIRYHMGACSQTYEDVKKAYVAMSGESERTVDGFVFGQEPPRPANAKLIDDIKEVLYKRQSHELDVAEALKAIAAIVEVTL